MKKKIVVMFHIGRSGSTVVADMLNQNNKIHWDGEIFEWLFQDFEKKNTKIIHKGDLSIDFTDFINNKLEINQSEIYGFEVKPYHLEILNIDINDFVAFLNKTYEVYYIILKRKNFLRKIVSSIIAHQTGLFHKTKDDHQLPFKFFLTPNKIFIDRDNKSLLILFETYEEAFQKILQTVTGKNKLLLTYEDDVQVTPFIAYSKICNLLNAEVCSFTKINFVKTNPFKLSEILLNYVEIKELLSKTRFSCFTND